jgi:parvulin-like peptidyl-prolyl isomerase
VAIDPMRIATFLLLCATATRQSSIAQEPFPAAPRLEVAAIDGKPILAAEVERELAEAYGQRELTAEEKAPLLRLALDQVVDRRLALRRLVRMGEAASKDDVDLALDKLEKQLAAQNFTLADHLQRVGLTPDELRQTVLWRLSWQSYLSKQLTDENLHKYFVRNRRDFDGTQLKVAHILIKPPGQDESARADAQGRAAAIRAAITGGKTTFADAAKEHSAGPSAKLGGDIGWIERRQPMPELFSAAAFALGAGEVSPPVTTTFGVHLIQVLEVKAGAKTWQDAADELKPAVTLYLFRWLAERERPTAKIQRVENWPESGNQGR